MKYLIYFFILGNGNNIELYVYNFNTQSFKLKCRIPALEKRMSLVEQLIYYKSFFFIFFKFLNVIIL